MHLALWLLVAIYPPAALAHLLQTDGDIGVLMHVDPGDEPAVGEQATLMFELNDRREAFRPDRCDCRLRILLNDKEVFNGALMGDKSASAAVPFVFTDAGIYRVEVAGDPRPGAAFKAFRVAFDVRVVPNESSGISWWLLVQKYWLLIVVVFAALITLAAFKRKYWRRQ